MDTKLSLKARLHDCDRRILLNHAKQEAIVFVRDGTSDSAEAMMGLKSEMGRLQLERANLQSKVILQRNPLFQPAILA